MSTIENPINYRSNLIDRNIYHVYDYISISRPEIVCLIGSSRFMREHTEAQKKLTLEGKIVLPMGMFGHYEPGFDMEGPIKKMLDELHFRKIDLADSIYVVNPKIGICPTCKKMPITWSMGHYTDCCGIPIQVVAYIGESTRRELAYAKKLGKNIYSLNPL